MDTFRKALNEKREYKCLKGVIEEELGISNEVKILAQRLTNKIVNEYVPGYILKVTPFSGKCGEYTISFSLKDYPKRVMALAESSDYKGVTYFNTREIMIFGYTINGKVPEDFDELLKLPGVGRKSANLVVGDVFGKPAIVTDTHCIRLANRIGLVKNEKNPKLPEKDPKKVEMQLWKIIPPEEGNALCHRFVLHGREVCSARTKPFCDRCCLHDLCKSAYTV